MKDNRNWPKIYFMTFLGLLLLGIFIIDIFWIYNTQQEQNSQIHYECEKRGLDYYEDSDSSANCINAYGGLYVLPETYSSPWYITLFQILLFIAFLISAIMCFNEVWNEYKLSKK